MKLKRTRFGKIRWVVLFVVIGIITWLAVSLILQDNTLELVETYELPEFNSMEDFDGEGVSKYALSVDGEMVAGGEGSDEISATASTAKMILALAVMREKPFGLNEVGETIEILQEDYDSYVSYYRNGGSVTEVEVGEEINEYDALSSLLLASSNNMADTLARWAFGSIDSYREYAMSMLNEWGINDTTIGEDASGFSESTTSSAKSLARVGYLVMQEPVLAEIVGLKEAEVPVAGLINNTNQLLGKNGIAGVKTGYIGEVSGYCLVSAYPSDGHVVSLALLGAPTRASSFDSSLALIRNSQELMPMMSLVNAGDVVGYYDSWWTGKVQIVADEDLSGIGWAEADTDIHLDITGREGVMMIRIGEVNLEIKVHSAEYNNSPSFWEKLMHVFGWRHEDTEESTESNDDTEEALEDELVEDAEEAEEPEEELEPITNAISDNCTISYGYLMLVNPNFMVEDSFIATRRTELISIYNNYGIVEGNAYNGDNLLDAEAGEHINEMVEAYKAEYPGHTLETRSCFRSVGTNCGRLCAETGASDHHTGLTCDLLDPAYGTELDTDYLAQHIDWQWLHENSYKYGFIDRFPEAWAGGSMLEPLNVDENGSTGLYETWHYRYVGVGPATEIATGKYSNGEYDSLEHYLKSRGLVIDLKNGICK